MIPVVIVSIVTMSIGLFGFSLVHVLLVMMPVSLVAAWLTGRDEPDPAAADRLVCRSVNAGLRWRQRCYPRYAARAVYQHHWLSAGEFLDMFAISRAAPGPGSLIVLLIG